MVRGEPYEFVQLGLHLERATTTVRAIAARYPYRLVAASR